MRMILFFLLIVAAACATTADSDTLVPSDTPQDAWEVRADIPYRVQEVYPAQRANLFGGWV